MSRVTNTQKWILAATTVLAALGLSAAVHRADAARAVSVSPQGKVTQARQVVVKFDEPMTAFGNPAAAAPGKVSCSGAPAAATAGSARWIDQKTWAFDFAADLPPGVRCALDLDAGLKSTAGNALAGPSHFTFETGGPFVTAIQPDYGDIEEDQAFVLRLNGPATQASVLDHVWCESNAIGNRIPVRMLDSATRGAILKQFHYEKESDRVLTLACQQALPSATKMQLVYGVGVTGPSGIPNDVERRFDFKVREPFKAGFTCERENAQAPCTPLRPLRVTFTAPISRADAQKFVLRGPKGTAAPHFDPDNKDDEVSDVEFATPLPERASLTIEAPADLKDVSGRKLANADFFPLRTQTAPMPPLAKFSSGEFGIIESFAEPNMPAMLPVTLRHVEADLHVQGLNSGTSKITSLRVDADTDIRQWMKTVEAFGGMSIGQRTVESLAPHALSNGIAPIVTNTTGGVYFDARSLSLLSKHAGVETLTLPAADPKALRPFEVVGIPLGKPGFYVVELASPALGASLMAKHQAMYVRTSVLVTNLGVHLKQGRENSLVWVTTLDKGKPVPNAQVRVTDCNGEQVATGITDAEGIARIGKPLAPLHECNENSLAYGGFFVSARVNDPATGPDMAFVLSDWNRGIESWRFNVPTDMSSRRTTRAHTVFDRTLLRAGETVSMKHLMRVETLGGLAFPKRYPTRVTIRHVGSGQTWHLPLTWAADHSADSSFTVPTAAKLGEYSVSLDDGTAQGTSDDDDARVTESFETGSFRVEEFRLPVFKGSISAGDSKSAGLIAAREAPVAVRLEYVQGGAASKVPVAVSALVKDIASPFASQYDAFSFAPYRKPANDGASAPAEDQNDDDEAQQQQSDATTKLVADKERITLDRDGVGKLTVAPLPAVDAPKRLALEATFADPNGEVQTISGNTMLWPAAVAVGVKSGSWVSVGSTVPVQAIALDLQGKPRAGVPMQIKGVVHAMTSSRKRMVGGFYAYDNHTETNDLGTLCSGKSDDHGLLSCEAKLKQPGNIDLIAVAKDGDGREANATTSVWVTREDELWFGGENTDRIDVLPEKTSYEPGETARFQVRMPFRSATALVAVEREGIVETHVVELNGKDPTIDLKVQDAWGPNVYVSVLALRGRLRDVPWYSFFTWGWKAPVEWARAFWYEGRQYQAPTPLVDLSKPAFRYGLASIKVGIASHRLAVSVSPDAKSYAVRGKARVKVKVALPDGKAAPAGTQIAVAAVDEALLELMPNQSWNVLDAMLQQRAYGVETSTAQMEIIGRRHFGRKAVPAGGGGGHSATRELFDTLLLWNPRVTLDANGEATLDVPLNDSLTRFRIVAIAAVGAGRFGTGSATIQTSQDLQLVSGLPPLVRVGDTFRAQFTLRNTTPRAMRVLVTPRAGSLALDARTVSLAAESSQEVAWDVTPPDMPGGESSASLAWNVSAVEQGTGKASDALKLTQRIVAAIPVTVQQATIAQVDGTLSVPVAPPADATKTAAGAVRGGIAVSLQPKLADGLPGVRRWFLDYPYGCLEQQTSRALGLMDAAQWQAVLAHMATYLDADGLANYFPPYDDSRPTGSPTLTAYLLAVTDEAAKADRRFALPADLRDRLTAALTNFVDGKIQRNVWAPRNGFDFEKLAAIEALSRYGLAQPRMLDSITIAPNQWPTSAVLDYYAILSRVDGIADREAKRAQAEQIVRARLTYQGTRLTFSTAPDDDLWWLMTGVETNAARTALLFADAPGWKDEMPRLVAGLLALQTNGAWSTTTANLWGSLAVARFSRVFESTPVTGSTDIRLGASSQTVNWAAAAPAAMASATPITRTPNTRSALLPWSTGSLMLTQQGTGKPWATIESLAAVALKAPFAAGYRIAKIITPVEPAVKDVLSRGDVVRVSLDIDAQSDMTWVVVNDPIPAGATILGSGLGRDSESATQGEQNSGQWPVYVERAFDGYRAYFDYLPKGKLHVEYTMRLNNAGSFGLPPTRVEALYAPSTFGALPNARMVVKPLAAR